tara:strand:+ start:447 stop:842 length:396 start_codon:yes stop_codon:yes gene_type:complete
MVLLRSSSITSGLILYANMYCARRFANYMIGFTSHVFAKLDYRTSCLDRDIVEAGQKYGTNPTSAAAQHLNRTSVQYCLSQHRKLIDESYVAGRIYVAAFHNSNIAAFDVLNYGPFSEVPPPLPGPPPMDI